MVFDLFSKYEEDVQERNQQREQYRREQRRRGRRTRFAFPGELQPLPPLAEWVQEEVRRNQQEGILVDAMVVDTARGPLPIAAAYKSMHAFGNHYRVLSSERSRKTCDSGVAATFTQLYRNSTRDGNQVNAAVEYVGHIEEILELNYRRHCLVVLVCDFVKANYRGENATIKKDKWGFTLANYSRRYGTICKDSFAFPRHCEQVFYSSARESPGWRVVLRKEVRGKRILPTTNDDEGRLFGMGRDEDYEGLRPDREVGEQELPPAATGVDVVLDPLIRGNNVRRGGRAGHGDQRGAGGRRGRRGGRGVPRAGRIVDPDMNSRPEGDEEDQLHGGNNNHVHRRRGQHIQHGGIRNVRQRSVTEEEELTSDETSSEDETDHFGTTTSDASSETSDRSDEDQVRCVIE